MHFSWERVPQLTQVLYQFEESSKEEKKKDEFCFTWEYICAEVQNMHMFIFDK